MDNRKLRYAKRKAKEKILSQRDRAYYRNLNFRENPNEQAEASPEHYAAQNASLYGIKYADTVKAQGRKLLMQRKEREQQRKKLREQGGRAETLSSSEGFSWQPAEKRAGVQKNSRTTTSSVNQRQNLQDRRKKQAHISSVLREKGYVDRRYALPIFSRKAKERSSAGVKTAKRLSRSPLRWARAARRAGTGAQDGRQDARCGRRDPKASPRRCRAPSRQSEPACFRPSACR